MAPELVAMSFDVVTGNAFWWPSTISTIVVLGVTPKR